MSDEETLYEKGARNLNEVYAGDVVAMPEGTMPFIDVMTRTLFGEVWDRDVLSIRDRRLLLMGVIAAQGQSDIGKYKQNQHSNEENYRQMSFAKPLSCSPPTPDTPMLQVSSVTAKPLSVNGKPNKKKLVRPREHQF